MYKGNDLPNISSYESNGKSQWQMKHLIHLYIILRNNQIDKKNHNIQV